MDQQPIMQVVKDAMLNKISSDVKFRSGVYRMVWSHLHTNGIPEKDLGIATELVVVSFAELVIRIEYMFSKE